jgi:hypothetical protein
MPWRYPGNVPRPAKNWDKEAKKKCTRAANAVLRGGGSDQDAIRACIHAAGKTVHPGGKSHVAATVTRYRRFFDSAIKGGNMACCEDCAAQEKSMKLASVPVIANALKVLKGADPGVIASLVDDSALEKAVEALRSQDLEAGEIVTDRWRAGEVHKNPTREELKTGPSEASSGGGAEKMVRDYSRPAGQHGIQLEAEDFQRMLAPVASSVKAQGRALSALIEQMKGHGTFIAAIIKAAEDDEEEEEEDSEVVEINASKAKKLFAKARAQLASIEAIKAEMEDEEDKEEKKKAKAQIKALRKSAAKLLVKARLHASAAGKAGAPLRKSITDLIGGADAMLKADVNVVQEDEEDEEDDEEKAKAATATAATIAAAVPAVAAAAATPAVAAAAGTAEKAVTDTTGNQADRKDPATGNQDDAAKAQQLTTLQEQVKKATDGLGMLQMTIGQMFDVMRNRSAGTAAMPALAKADQEAAALSLHQQIEEMVGNGQLDQVNEFAAKDILNQLEAANKGQIDSTIVRDRIQKAPTIIRNLFEPHAMKLAA